MTTKTTLALTAEEANFAATALRHAADQYRRDADTIANQPRLEAQFRLQAEKALRLADKIESYANAKVSP